MSASIVKPDGAALVFDATPRIAYSRTITTTKHPIENGSKITDHAVAEPLLISVTGVVTESPLAVSSATTGGVSRVLAAIEFLNGCAGVLLDLVDPRLGTTSSCLLTRWPTEVDQVRRQEFGIELEQVTIASATTVLFGAVAPLPSAPADEALLATILGNAAAAQALLVNAQAAGEQDVGAQGTSDSGTDPSAEATDTSLLLTGLQATGAV